VRRVLPYTDNLRYIGGVRDLSVRGKMREGEKRRILRITVCMTLKESTEGEGMSREPTKRL